ncbi:MULTISPECIES: hypothetical protein [unclassified Marinitoga]|uniref:hypothetical protein n=1 Tax=unclassified Marinitoga TaxID=2640159 RepID=UPI000640D240|nr:MULTISPECIES: hypothetical protein [unclassified Marinitoga]KLO24141.1 hypothetical protein X274_04400 [Marinitoga sp. 1155]NUU99386.1 hypothetical protein [Marinitoga sp. 1154]
MKKILVFLLISILGLFLLTGCLVKEKIDDEKTVLSLSELREKILENKNIWNDYDSHETVYETEGIVAYQYTSNSDPTKNYIYIVDENGNGLKLTYLKAENHDSKYSIGDKIKVKGIPYYKTWNDPNVYELRMDIDNYGEITVVEKNVGVPLNKAELINSELSGGDFGNLVEFTGKYIGEDDFNNKEFSVINFELKIDSHSVLPDLTLNSTYTIKGVVGQNYGYRIFVSDETWVTLVATAEEQPQPTVEASTIAEIKNEIKENYDAGTDGWDSGDTSIVPLRKIENAIVVYDASDYGYVYAVSNDGTGIYVKISTDLNINLNEIISATGRPYYTERDATNSYFEYRFNTTRSDESATVTSSNGTIPWDKADVLTVNNLPGMNNFGNLVIFEGKYLGQDEYKHYDFDLDNDGQSDLKVIKYSSDAMNSAGIQVGNLYEIKGVIGYNYGFKVYVGDSSFVTAK